MAATYDYFILRERSFTSATLPHIHARARRTHTGPDDEFLIYNPEGQQHEGTPLTTHAVLSGGCSRRRRFPTDETQRDARFNG